MRLYPDLLDWISKYPIKYLELVFALTSFEITILSALTSQIFIGLFAAWNLCVAIFLSPNLTIIIL